MKTFYLFEYFMQNTFAQSTTKKYFYEVFKAFIICNMHDVLYRSYGNELTGL